MSVTDRFLRYVKIDTQSDSTSKSSPSTAKQLDLSKLLLKELQELGLKASLDSNGIVFATIPSNIAKKVPTVGFIAHVDTASELTGANVQPQLIKNYDGGDIVLNAAQGIVMKIADFPLLGENKGDDLIVTNGLTLLGADDKAGVAEIMELAEQLVKHPEIKHGIIQIAFTPDEEIGRGTVHFDIAKFAADFAFTVDGSRVGGIDYENFNAASADILFKGRSIHPGSAKGKLINALHLAMEFHHLLPPFQNPAFTENYEGFNHLTELTGSVDEARMHYIIRNHDAQLLEQQKETFRQVAAFINQREKTERVILNLQDTYRNMKEKLMDKMYIIELAKQATLQVGLQPFSTPIRGGTDGANLTYKGLPCPNLGTGGYNYHGRYEYASIQEMEQSVAILKSLVSLIPNFSFPK